MRTRAAADAAIYLIYMSDLSNNEFIVKEQLPDGTAELADTLGCKDSYVYDIISSLRRKGYNIEQNDAGEYEIIGAPREEVAASRQSPSPSEKSAITRKARKILSELEHQLRQDLERMEPAATEVPSDLGDGDLILHRTDDHFGEEITAPGGEVIYDSPTTELRVREYFEQAREFLAEQRLIGRDVDVAHLLLGGDIVTNESIYEGQAHDIDENLHQQIDRASEVYLQEIRKLSEEVSTVQVVCQAGNHGELRAPNSSAAANADDILYMMLDKMVRESDVDNVTFVTSDSPYFTNFTVRDYNGHLRHGHDASLEHIGTSAGKQRWESWRGRHDFDVAFRGHYHMYKEEPIGDGIPVHMGGTPAPISDFEESRAINGAPKSAVHLATDTSPTEYTRKVHFE